MSDIHERTPKAPPKIEPLKDVTHRPRWSVMIPSYNCIEYLRDTIQSVLLQAPSAEEMQIEVIDDYSNDGDVELLVNQLGNERIGFYRQARNVGSLRNFETCINRAKGELVHILHGDDVVKQGFYQEIDELFGKFPDIGAAFTGCTDFDENSVPLWDSVPILDRPGIIDGWLIKIAEGQKVQAPSMVVKRSVYEHLGSFFGVHYGEDWEMWTRIAAHYKVAYSPKILACYRVHSNNITGRSLITGQNVKDIAFVIDTIQNYLPEEQRRELKSRAKRNYAYYIAGTADRLYHSGRPRSALIQVWKAYLLHRNRRTFFSLLKIPIKVLIRYKNLR